MTLALIFTSVVWVSLEVGLRVRDRRGGRGSTSGDKSTRMVIVGVMLPVVLAATLFGTLLPAHSVLALPGSRNAPWPQSAGLAFMWIGLITRAWAVVALGSSFRTTVEVHEGQALVDHGPFRWVRHPSYAGALMVMAGFGLFWNNWPSLAISVIFPALAILPRISVEERALTEIMGQSYTDYSARTRRLVPLVW